MGTVSECYSSSIFTVSALVSICMNYYAWETSRIQGLSIFSNADTVPNLSESASLMLITFDRVSNNACALTQGPQTGGKPK